jgi:hypothetical protein
MLELKSLQLDVQTLQQNRELDKKEFQDLLLPLTLTLLVFKKISILCKQILKNYLLLLKGQQSHHLEDRLVLQLELH